MTNILTAEALRTIICDLAPAISAQAEFLTRLDTAIGDGDHGRNMAIGLAAVRQELLRAPVSAPGLTLRSTGMTLVTTVGGASGPLYSAAFIAAGIAARQHDVLSLADLAHMTRSAADALARRGRAHVGDKTILDALDPAAAALERAAADGRSLLYGLQTAAAAAQRGMEATIPLIARCGLAMQYGAASAGHQDPGATSCAIMFAAIVRTFRRLYPLAR